MGIPESTRRTRLAESIAPLSADATRLAIDWMRTMIQLVRARRLFPQWAAAADAPRQLLLTASRGLLALLSSVTFAIDPRGLMINSRPIAGTTIAFDFERLIRQRGIESLTIAAGLQAEELDSFLNDLAAAPARTIGASRWQDFLTAARITHLDVRQGFLAPVSTAAFAIDEPPLEIDELDQLWLAFRHLKSAIERLRQSPPTDHNVLTAMARVGTAFTSILSRRPRVSFSVRETGVQVNGIDVHPGAASDAAELVASSLTARGHRRLTLLQNITADEIQALVSFFCVDDADIARGILAAIASTHIFLDLEEEGEPKLPDDPDSLAFPSGAAETELLPLDAATAGERPEQIDVRASFWLQAPIDQFLSEMAEQEFASTLDALAAANAPKSTTRLLDRLAVYLADPDAQCRARALGILVSALETSKAGLAALLLRSRAPLRVFFDEETDSTLFLRIALATRAWIAGALSAWPVTTAAEFLVRDLRPFVDRENRRDLKLLVTPQLRSLAEGSNLDPVINALRTGPSPLRQAAAQILASVGPPAVPRLVELIIASDSMEIRHSAAGALRIVGGAGQADLAKRVKDATPAETLCRILSVLEIAGRESLATPVFAALTHADRSVRAAAFALVKRVDRAMALAILRRTLSTEDAEIKAASVTVASDLALGELLRDVITIAAETTDEALALACCAYLSACPSPSGLSALKRIFEFKRSLLRKGFTDATRAAAVSAALKINHPDVKTILVAARADRSEAVRAAAQQA